MTVVKRLNSHLVKVVEGVKRYSLASLLSVTGLLAVLMRVFYSAVIFNQTLYSGDAYGVLLQSYFISKGHFSPRIVNLWGAKSITTLMYGFFIRILPFDPIVSVRIVTCLFTTAAILILTYIAYRYIDKTVALFFGVLLALNPYWSFVSTEPEKAPLVVFLFSVSLLFLFLYRYQEKGRKRNLALLSLFYFLLLLSYKTSVFFAATLLIVYVVFAWDMRYRGKRLRLLTDRFLYVLVAITLFAEAVLPRTVEVLFTYQSIYPKVTTGASAAAQGELAKYLKNFFYTIAHPERLAFRPFLQAIRNFTGAAVFGICLLGILVFIFASADRRKRISTVPFLAWLVVVTLAISLQAFSYSHGNRYPYYVIPVFLFFAAYFLGWFVKSIKIRGSMKQAVFITLIVLLIVGLQLNLARPAGAC